MGKTIEKMDRQVMIIMTEDDLAKLITSAVNAAVSGLTLRPRFVSAEVLASRFEVKPGKHLLPATVRNWSILEPARKEFNGNLFFDEKMAFEIIQNTRLNA